MEIKPTGSAKPSKGFSVIELTVVIGLLSILSLAISAIMLSTIVSSNRVRTLTKIKQAGDYALNQLQSLTRNARGVIACDSGLNTVTLLNRDTNQTSLLLESDANGIPRIASNSATYLTPGNLRVTNFNLDCQPDDDNPRLISVSFDLSTAVASTKNIENATLHFSTTSELRNN